MRSIASGKGTWRRRAGRESENLGTQTLTKVAICMKIGRRGPLRDLDDGGEETTISTLFCIVCSSQVASFVAFPELFLHFGLLQSAPNLSEPTQKERGRWPTLSESTHPSGLP